MESEFENLQLEIKGALYKLTVEQLIKVCNALQIPGPGEEQVTGKTRGQLIAHVIKYLEREELADLEDEGMSDLLNAQDIIDKVQMTTNQNEGEILTQTDEQQNLQEEVEALRLSLQEKENALYGLVNTSTNPPAKSSTPLHKTSVQPRARKRSVKEAQEAEKSEEEDDDDDDEYYLAPAPPQQQPGSCSPETVNPVCTTTPQEPECIQPEENMLPEQEEEQELTNQEENLPELEDNHIEDLPVEVAAHSPVPSVPSAEELQRPRRQHRRPKIFTYDRLGSPACYNLRTRQQYNNYRVPWTYTVQPHHFQRQRKRVLAEQGSNMLPSVGYRSCNAVFTAEQELSLVAYIRNAAALYYGLPPKEVRKLAFELAAFYRLPCPPHWAENGMARASWFTNFMQRHQLYKKHNSEAKDVWNVDETGLVTVQKPGFLVATKGVRRVGAVTSAERGVLVIMALAGNALGNITRDHPFCRENGVVILSFPPHCTHHLQPLDKAVYGPFKKHFNSEMGKWHREHPGETLTIYDLPQLLNNILLLAASPLNVKKGFSSTGIWPYKADIFKKDDFLPASVTDRPPPEASLPEPSTAAPTTSGPFAAAFTPGSSATALTTAGPSMVNLSPPERFSASLTTAGPSVVNLSPPEPSNASLTSAGPSTVILSSSTALSGPVITENSEGVQEVTLTLVEVPLSIQEEETITTEVNRQCRRKRISTILTDTPEKEALKEEKKESSLKVKRKISAEKKEGGKKKKKSAEDTQCLVCEEWFSRSKQGEQWVSCSRCGMWSHVECTTGSQSYICHHCEE
ncbi:hypothetical protein ABVT39_013405 [Epinephelus coioides]